MFSFSPLRPEIQKETTLQLRLFSNQESFLSGTKKDIPDIIPCKLDRERGELKVVTSVWNAKITYYSQPDPTTRTGEINCQLELDFTFSCFKVESSVNSIRYRLSLNNSSSLNLHWKVHDTTKYSEFDTRIEDLDYERNRTYYDINGELIYSKEHGYIESFHFALPTLGLQSYPVTSSVSYSRTDQQITIHCLMPPRYESFPNYFIPALALGDYVTGFSIKRDGWGFSNSQGLPGAGIWDVITPLMWPDFYWINIDYSTSPPAPEGYECDIFDPQKSNSCGLNSYDFPSWPLFESVFKSQIYEINGMSSRYPKEKAVELWKSLKGEWNGSCFGFAISSLLHYVNPIYHFPDYDENVLYNINANYYNSGGEIKFQKYRDSINRYYLHQFGRQHINYFSTIASSNSGPHDEITHLKNTILDDNINNLRTLSIFNKRAGHTVVPIYVHETIKNDSVYVYDNNAPYLDSWITVTGNKWEFSNLQWSNQNTGLYLDDAIVAYLSDPILPINTESVNAFRCTNSSIYLINLKKNQFVYDIETDSLDNTIEGVSSLLGHQIAAKGSIFYMFPPESYEIILTNPQKDVEQLTLFLTEDIIKYERLNVAKSETDIVKLDVDKKRVILINPDHSPKSVNLSKIGSKINEEEMIFSISNLSLSGVDTVTVDYSIVEEIQIINNGSPKSYNLELRLTGQYDRSSFIHFAIEIPKNTTQIIKPQWSDITNTIIIDIDANNDGNPDSVTK